MNITTPRTIEELKQWSEERNLPLNQMRTYIGENVSFPCAYGIYKDPYTGEFVVYKNKDTGERAIRYKGYDEAFAVNELWQKMKERIRVQKSVKVTHGTKVKRGRRDYSGLWLILGYFFLAFLCNGLIHTFRSSKHKGYYDYNGVTYYYSANSNWYYYDEDYDDWFSTTLNKDLWDYEDAYYSKSYEDNEYYSDWTESSRYDWESSYYDDSDDYDYSWDSNDSWDSSYDDWGSDW